MTRMFRCPGELRHVTRGFLYDEQDFADADKARAEGWFDSLEEAAGLVSPVAAALANVEGESVEEVQEFARQKAVQVGILAPSRADMITALEAAGVDVDGRWGDKRIAVEFAKLKGA